MKHTRFQIVALLLAVVFLARGELFAQVNQANEDEWKHRIKHSRKGHEPLDVEVSQTVHGEPLYTEQIEELSIGKPSTETQVFTLDDCIKQALDRNQRLKAAGYDIEAAKGRAEEASAQFWPILDYTYQMAPVPKDVGNAFNDFFDGQVTLYNSISMMIAFPVTAFGQIQTAKRLAAGGISAAHTNHVKTRETVIYQTKQLYYGIQFAQETIRLLEDAIGKLKDKIDSEEKKDEKSISPYDLLQLKGFKIDMERRLSEAKQNMELAYEGLRVQMDIESGSPVKLDSSKLQPLLASLSNEDEYISEAVKIHPDAKLIDIGIDTKRLLHKLEKQKMLPTAGFGFYMDFARTATHVAGIVDTGAYTDPFNYTRAGIGLRIKGSLDLHGAHARLRRTKAEYFKASYDGFIGRRALELDIRKAFLNAKRAQEDVKRAKEGQSVSNQMMFVSKLNMDTGVGEEQQYGDSLKYVLLSKGLYYKAVFDYNVALADLEQRVGRAKYEELVPSAGIKDYELFGLDSEK